MDNRTVLIGDNNYIHANTAALMVQPESSTNICLHLYGAANQAKPLLQTKSAVGNYDNGTGMSGSQTDNHAINQHGFLKLPVFASSSALYNLVGGTGGNSDYLGMMALFDNDGEGTYRQVYYDGLSWRWTGSSQDTI